MPGQLLRIAMNPSCLYPSAPLSLLCVLYSQKGKLFLQLQLHSCVVRPHFREGVPQPSRFLPTVCLCDHSPSVMAPTETADFFVLFLEKQIIDNSWKIGRCYRHSHEAIMEHITDKEIQVVRGAGLPIVVNLCRHLSASDQAV